MIKITVFNLSKTINKTKKMDQKTNCISSSPNLRPQSPLGLARQSRMAEKVELQNLNDRLACYIERVRFLEVENSRLSHEVQTIVESHNREKCMFESDFENVRKVLDESAKEKTQLEIETNRLYEENANLKNHLEKKTEELSVAQSFEPKYNDLLAKYNEIDADWKMALDANNELEKEVAHLNSAMDDLRKHFEAEKLARVEMEKMAQSLREKLILSVQMDQETDDETYTLKTNFTSASNDGANLENSLHKLLDHYKTLMRANREEIDTLYKARIENLQDETDRANASAASAIEEVRNARNQISSLNAKISELEGQTSRYLERIRELESMLDNSIRQRGEDEAEIHRLRELMAQQAQEYQDLMDIRVSLDLEIAAYNELLASEEERLKNLNRADYEFLPTIDQAAPIDRKTKSRKRKRISSDIETNDIEMPSYSIVSSATGDLEIQDSSSEGKFVKIFNKGDSEIAIGGWHLKRTANGNETVFKFRRSIIIEPKTTITVWSANAEAQHDAPSNIVMKRNWIPSEISKTQLFNDDHEEIANFERKEIDTQTIHLEIA